MRIGPAFALLAKTGPSSKLSDDFRLVRCPESTISGLAVSSTSTGPGTAARDLAHRRIGPAPTSESQIQPLNSTSRSHCIGRLNMLTNIKLLTIYYYILVALWIMPKTGDMLPNFF
jgi:hypothetical protein